MDAATAKERDRPASLPAPTVAAFTLRYTSLGIGLAAFVFGILALGPWRAQTSPGFEIRNALSFAVAIVWPIINAGLATRVGPQLMRRLNGSYAAAYLLALCDYLFFGQPGVDDFGRHWLTSVLGVPAVAAMSAVAGRAAWLGWLYATSASVLCTAVVYRASTSSNRLIESLQTGAYAFTLCVFFVGFASVGLIAAARLDARLESEASAQAASVARVARERERNRIDALVHDSVISTLLVAGRGTASQTEIAAQAFRALHALSSEGADDFATPHVLSDSLRGLIFEIAPIASFDSQISTESAIPSPVATAVTGAAAEALRNAVRHGPTPGQALGIFVTFCVSEEGIRLVIRDDGCGFDTESVPPERMGIRRSITARMVAVGGSAGVVSAIGLGTTVSIEWIRL